MLKNMGSSQFGLYIFLSSFVPLASVFDFGISLATVRELSYPQNTQQEKNKIWQTSFYLFLVLAILLFFANYFFLDYLRVVMPIFQLLSKSTLQVIFAIISFTVFINHLNAHFLCLPQANQRFDVFNSKTFLVGTANTLFSAIYTNYYSDFIGIFSLQLFFHLITFVYMAWYGIKYFFGKDFWPKLHIKEAKKLISFGFKNFIGILAGQLEAQITKFFLGAYSTAQEIANFNIPQNIVAKAAGVVSQFSQAFFPLSASLLQKEKILKLKKLFVNLQILIGAGSLLGIVVIHFVGQPFLHWWLKDAQVVAAAYPVLQVLMYYFVLVALTPIPTALVQGLNKPQIASFFAVLTITLEIVTLFYFVPKYQALGAAYSFLISSLISVPAFIVTSWLVFLKEIDIVTKEK